MGIALRVIVRLCLLGHCKTFRPLFDWFGSLVWCICVCFLIRHADADKPTIADVSFVSDAPNNKFAGIDSMLTLTFTVTDDNDLPTANNWAPVAKINGVIAVAGEITLISSKSKTYVYTYVVPGDAVSGSSIGYTIDADDAGNNDADQAVPTASAKITVGMYKFCASSFGSTL